MTRERWVPFLLMVFVVGILIRIPILVALPAAMLVIIGVATWWSNHALEGVIYRRHFHFKRAFPGEVVPVKLDIENRKILPLSWLKVLDPWPKMVGPEDEDILAPSHVPDQGLLTNVFSLRWFERARRSYQLLFRKRGVYAVGPAQLSSGDLFGFYEQITRHGPSEYLTVFPQLIPIEEFNLPAEDPFGDLRSQRRLFEDTNRPMGVRDYRPEDGFRRIHWPATARTGELQVKVYQPTSAPVMLICLNAATFTRFWEGYYPAMLEYLLSLAATLADQGLQAGYKVGLISNGCLAHADQPFRIPPGRTPQHLAILFQALSSVTPVVTGQFERLLQREIPRMPYGATLLVLTGTDSPELAEILLQIKRHERKVVLFSLAKEIPLPIQGITIHHRPFKEEELVLSARDNL